MVDCKLQHLPQVGLLGEVSLAQDDDRRAASPALVYVAEVLVVGSAEVVQSLVEIPDPLPLETHHPVGKRVHEAHAGVLLRDKEGPHLGVATEPAHLLVQPA